ncbi:thioredoxin family protein (plasmid) [Fructilactobacillus vespulae]|uniref:thioredoxin family protein n=1 Tax=Fructilactobacillus vespulae TaxID=1249630 RepID=UPI0039B454F0
MNKEVKQSQKRTRKRKIVVGVLISIVGLVTVVGLWIHFNFTAFETNPNEIKTALSDQSLAKHDVQVYFYRPGCSHCKQVRWQVLGEETFNGNQQIKYVNVNVLNPKNQKYVEKYGIFKTPTMVHLVDGHEQERKQLVNDELK